TIIYRFKFISDSLQTFKDGLMFDDFKFIDYFESIEELQNDNLISIYPNPTTYQLNIHSTTSSNRETIQIFNYLGQVVYDNQNFNDERIDIRRLDSGVFYLKYSDTKSYAIKSFVVTH
ncbi:MAG: T9SS type A sorting domain-containing protein, partial [Candidatus Magasanikbacteria bacterium]|nr:T9SS type A sorting domain-containing protein [Candidatus Magasanikbacteria bacterium]